MLGEGQGGRREGMGGCEKYCPNRWGPKAQPMALVWCGDGSEEKPCPPTKGETTSCAPYGFKKLVVADAGTRSRTVGTGERKADKRNALRRRQAEIAPRNKPGLQYKTGPSGTTNENRSSREKTLSGFNLEWVMVLRKCHARQRTETPHVHRMVSRGLQLQMLEQGVVPSVMVNGKPRSGNRSS